MTRFLLLLALLAPSALAQTGAPHALPFPADAPETHAIELSLSGSEGEALSVAVAAAPDWLRFDAPSVRTGEAEPVARLAFRVAPSAPVGEAVSVELLVTDAAGRERARHVVRVVVAAPAVELSAPRPNPSRSGAVVAWTQPAGAATLAVYDVLGRRVAVLADGEQVAGAHQRRLPALASGTYVVRLAVGDALRVEQLTVAR